MGWKRNTFRKWLCSFIVIFFNYDISSSQIDESIAKHKQNFENVALTIWDHAELGYLETKSSDLLKTTLQNNGFSVTNNVANIPTAFIAEYGNNGPVIAILGEFDALPGLAQNAVPYKDNTDLSSSNGACLWASFIRSSFCLGCSCSQRVVGRIWSKRYCQVLWHPC